MFDVIYPLIKATAFTIYQQFFLINSFNIVILFDLTFTANCFDMLGIVFKRLTGNKKNA